MDDDEQEARQAWWARVNKDREIQREWLSLDNEALWTRLN
jgi:hypothetical protein